MTPAQTSLYFFEWGQVRKHYLAKGIDSKQVDHKRHDLHRRALGRDKSSKDFSNAELDKVIAVFRAVYDGGNLDAQLAQLDQLEFRRTSLIKRCHAAAGSFIEGADDEAKARNLRAYLDGTADRMFGVAFVHLDRDQEGDAQLRKVMGALERTARIRKEKARLEREDPY